MKLKELVQKVIKSEDNKAYIDIYDMAEYLGIYNLETVPDEQLDRLTAYWVGSHICYDTEIGIKIIFLDDNMIAISKQRFRKGDQIFEWVSKEVAIEIANWLREITAEQFEVDIMNLDEDMGTCYLEDDGKSHPWNIKE